MSEVGTAWDELQGRATATPVGRFGAGTVASLPAPVQRHLRAALAEGTPLAAAVRLEMRGQIKVGRWLPFRARQLLAPRSGTVWVATVAGVIRGSDRYVAGRGAMAWKLLGLVPVVRAGGADVSRSAAERAAAESIWAPTAMAADGGVTWSAPEDGRLDVRFRVDDAHDVELHHAVDGAGRLRSSHLRRWGDPDGTGTFAEHPFGVEVTGHRRFDGVTIPSEGRAGWHFGTERWDDGVFFRYEITGYELVHGPAQHGSSG